MVHRVNKQCPYRVQRENVPMTPKGVRYIPPGACWWGRVFDFSLADRLLCKKIQQLEQVKNEVAGRGNRTLRARASFAEPAQSASRPAPRLLRKNFHIKKQIENYTTDSRYYSASSE